MEGGMRSGEISGIVVKNRTSSGCLIVRKKSDGPGGVGSSGTRPLFKSKKEKKRPRVVMSDSGSSDELLMPHRTRIRPETIQGSNGLGVYSKGVSCEAEISRKRVREDRFVQNEDGFVHRNGQHLGVSNKNMLDVYDFDEYDRIEEQVLPKGKQLEYREQHFDDRKLLSTMHRKVNGVERDCESGPSRHVLIEGKKNNLYSDKNKRLNLGNGNDASGLRKGRDGGDQQPLSLLRERHIDSDESIRVQGKNGVLKVMVNKKRMTGLPLKKIDHLEVEKSRIGSRVKNNFRRKIQGSPFHVEADVAEKRSSLVKLEGKQKKLLSSSPAMKCNDSDDDFDDNDRSLRVRQKTVESSKLLKKTSLGVEKMQDECTLTAKTKEGKGKRGCGTEKQKLREKIRQMLLDAGWTIDYRPRRNRDYLDAVYINPSGTAYWSIIKAYDALQKQLNDEENENQNCGDGSALVPLPDEVLSQLTRKTRKKMEQEMKKKRVKDSCGRKSSIRDEDDSMDSLSHEEKLSSFIKQGKSLKNRTDASEHASLSSKNQGSTLHVHDSQKLLSARIVQGRKMKNVGRCTLLVRNSEGPNSEDDGFVPYAGKRTVLSWLIDSGAVHLSQKVQYMNRRRSRVMLEGWITRDGIHCGCCSKILTVSKFEIHAGSKLRQPFQNIYLDSGVSLLQCQMEAWNRLEKSECIGFRTIDTDGEDPNDDTCGICGDGGDLICCDSCPSTYHQSCLSIDHLPPGDWHCPNCTCKFCGVGGDIVDDEEEENNSVLLTCKLCEKKYHSLCVKEIHALHSESTGLVIYFCEEKCRELFEHLQKMLGVKCELEAGFSWTLVHRTDADSDSFLRGLQQKVECNSKLAVALNVMDECFLPIIDRRSGTNLIHNVLYNCGSNFNRLNYSGFYTAVLERGDEIISAASLRFHGTRVAEMPFIGTRHIYRNQGMCRRLFSAIESALRALEIEKLVIPAIAELTHTWTSAFGFTPLMEKNKEDLRSLNMLVFPGIDMLQKLLMVQENAEAGITTGKELKHCRKPKSVKVPEKGSKSDTDSSSGHDTDRHIVSGTANLSETSPEHNASVSADGTSGDAQSIEKRNEYASEGKHLFNSDTDHGMLDTNNPVPGSPADDNTPSCTEGNVKDVCVGSVTESEALVPVDIDCDVSKLLDRVPELFDRKELCRSSVSQKLVRMERKLGVDSLANNFMGSRDNCQAAQLEDNNISASDEVKTQCTGDQNSCTVSRSGQSLTDSPGNCLFSSDTSPNGLNGESKMVLDAGGESDLQSKGSDASNFHGCGINHKAGPHDPELVQESVAAFDTGVNLLEPALDRSYDPVDTDHDTMEKGNTPMLDHRASARRSTEMNDNVACFKSTSSLREAITGISIKESDDYAGISAASHSDLHD